MHKSIKQLWLKLYDQQKYWAQLYKQSWQISSQNRENLRVRSTCDSLAYVERIDLNITILHFDFIFSMAKFAIKLLFDLLMWHSMPFRDFKGCKFEWSFCRFPYLTWKVASHSQISPFRLFIPSSKARSAISKTNSIQGIVSEQIMFMQSDSLPFSVSRFS